MMSTLFLINMSVFTRQDGGRGRGDSGYDGEWAKGAGGGGDGGWSSGGKGDDQRRMREKL